MSLSHPLACLILAACAWLAMPRLATAQAEPVEIVTNGSFESPVDPQFGPPPTNWFIGAPGPSVVNYAWLQPIWSLQGPNPDGDQIAALYGNCQQTVGVLQADKLYTLKFSVYFRTTEQFYGDLTTTPYSGGLLRFIWDGAIVAGLPSPVPLNQWLDLEATVDTSLPAFADQVGQPLFVHFWSTTSANEILLDAVSLTVQDSPGPPPVTYFVSSSTGSDANDGLTPETAWQTFAPLAPLTLGPNMTVSLRRGDTWPNSKLVLRGKGTPADPIRLTAHGHGPNPIITGINRTTEPAVVINNPSHWEIDSLDLRDAKVGLYLRFTGGNTDGTGAMFNNEGITVSHCNFQGMDLEWSNEVGEITVVSPFELSWGAGIWVGGNIPSPPGGPWPSVTTTVLSGLTVRHCSFQDCSTGVGNGWYFPGAYKERVTGMLLEDSWVTGCENGSFALFSTSDSTIRRWDTFLGGDGFYASGTTAGFLEDTRAITIEDCQFAFNKRNQTGNDGVGMDFEGATVDSVFRHNVIHSNDGAGMLILPTNGNNTNLQMTSNTFWNNARNPKDSSQNKELIASNNSHSGSFANNGVYLGTNINPPGGLAVYNSVTRWNTLFGANTGGNRTTTSFATVSSRPVAWDFSTGVQGWGNANQWTGFGASGGALVGTSAGPDPYAESAATWVNTRERRWVVVRMSQTAGANAQVFFQTETDPTWTEAKSKFFPIVADGQMRTYIVDLDGVKEYRGVVTRWRLDPTDAAGSTMVIEDFGSRIEPFVRSVTAISPTEINVAFNMAMLPQGGVMDPASYTISGAGAGSLAANPDSVTQLPTANGPVYRLKWNTGAMADSAATLSVVGAQNARGHAIGGVPEASTVPFLGIAPPGSVTGWQLGR